MRIIAELTEKEIKCVEYLSKNSWVYWYVWSPYNQNQADKNFTFRSLYKEELSTFWKWEVFKQNQITGKAEVNEKWLEVFRNALRQQQCSTTEN